MCEWWLHDYNFKFIYNMQLWTNVPYWAYLVKVLNNIEIIFFIHANLNIDGSEPW